MTSIIKMNIDDPHLTEIDQKIRQAICTISTTGKRSTTAAEMIGILYIITGELSRGEEI